MGVAQLPYWIPIKKKKKKITVYAIAELDKKNG